MAFLVLMEASQSAQEDLNAIMANVKAVAKAKEECRRRHHDKHRSALDFESILQLAATLYAKQLTAELHEIQDDLDSASELGEMESLRLQMAMDRMSKMMATLSNLMKKVPDTASGIVQNLK